MDSNQTKAQQIAEFSETQAQLAAEWQRLNAIAGEWGRQEQEAIRKAREARRLAEKAYLALHDHVFGINFNRHNEV